MSEAEAMDRTADTKQASYRIKFDRIGRNGSVADLVTTVSSLDDLAEKIHSYARPFIRSRHYEVELNFDGEPRTSYLRRAMQRRDAQSP